MGLVVVLGLCLIFAPLLIVAAYFITKGKKKYVFDKHVALVKANKGTLGVIVAYLDKLFLGSSMVSLGFLMSEELDNDYALKILVISLVLYIIVRYFDKKNKW